MCKSLILKKINKKTIKLLQSEKNCVKILLDVLIDVSGGVIKWQNVMFAERALLSVSRSATLIEDLIEPGSLT